MYSIPTKDLVFLLSCNASNSLVAFPNMRKTNASKSLVRGEACCGNAASLAVLPALLRLPICGQKLRCQSCLMRHNSISTHAQAGPQRIIILRIRQPTGRARTARVEVNSAALRGAMHSGTAGDTRHIRNWQRQAVGKRDVCRLASPG